MAYSWVFEKKQYNNYIIYGGSLITKEWTALEKGSYDGDVSHLTPGFSQYFLITEEEATEKYVARDKEEHWYTVTETADFNEAVSQLRQTPQYGKNCRAEIIDPIPLPNLYLSPKEETDEVRNSKCWYFSLFGSSCTSRGLHLHR